MTKLILIELVGNLIHNDELSLDSIFEVLTDELPDVLCMKKLKALSNLHATACTLLVLLRLF